MTTKTILNKDHVYELVEENKYPVAGGTKFLSRCIDGRYPNGDNLPALAFPGADTGELALILATANSYGFEVDEEKILKTLVNVVGGVKNFNMHSDHHGDPIIPASGCGHMKQIGLDPKAYQLTEFQVKTLGDLLVKLKKQGASETILDGDHQEGAVLMIRGQFGVLPRFLLEEEGKKIETQVFIYHSTLVDARHRTLSEELIKDESVILPAGFDEEYLYQAMSDMAENHLMETARKLAKGLPIYQVEFDPDGNFRIEEMGTIV